MVFVFLFLTYFTVYDRLKVHPPHYKLCNFISFHDSVIFHCIYVPHLLFFNVFIGV